jgi:hypothetical protein
MREVVKKEVLKLLKAGVIYPISDNGATIICNDKNELIPQRLSPIGGCVLTSGSSTKLLRKIISRYPSLMKC